MHALKRLFEFIKTHWQTLLVWGGGTAFIIAGFLLLWAATLEIPDLSSLQNRKVEQSLKIYDRTGEVLLYDLNQNVQRTVVPLGQISGIMQTAVVAVEDPTFYTNSGIEPTAIARAIVMDVLHLGAVQGGSTITQQVVKQAILTSDKSIARKLKEWILALKLTRVLPKNQILELYLNQVPLGGSIYGVEQASETFFGVRASDLSLAQAAYLTAVLPAPTYYSPYGNHKSALDARKNFVLSRMYERGYITQEQRDQAQKTEVAFQPPRDRSIQAPHFVFYVRQYLEDKYGVDAIAVGGWSVVTTLDANLQAKAEEIVQKYAPTNLANFNASNEGLVAIDPENGQILTMVGSKNYFDNTIDGNYNITLAKRQPGSTFKPFAYAEAFSKGYTPDTVLFDVPTQFQSNCAPDNLTNNATNGDCYAPVDYDNKWRGPMTLRDAIAQSINVPSVKVLYLAGIADTLTLAKTMGLTTLGDANQYGLTLVLGGGEVTPLEMTSAYGAFAQDGVHYPTTPILKITDGSGAVVEDNSQPPGTQILAPEIAEKINDVLSDNVARAPLGENQYLNFPGRDVAVKTGTTNNYKDAWVIGYSPNIAVGAWAGNNNNTPMAKKVGGLIVAPFWHEFMDYALSTRPPQSFTRAEYAPATKPALAGQWQIPGNDGVPHEILYWVDKSNPTGPPPLVPQSDPQFKLWEYGAQQWVASHGMTPTNSPVVAL